MEVLKVKPVDFDKIKRFTTSVKQKSFIRDLTAIDGFLLALADKSKPEKYELNFGDLRYEIAFISLTQSAGSACGLSLILYAEYKLNGIWRALPSLKYSVQAVGKLMELKTLVK